MTDILDRLGQFGQSLGSPLQNISEYLPYLAAGIALMIVGLIAARLLRAVIVRLGSSLNSVLERLGTPAGTAGLRLSPKLITLLGNLVFWVVILLFAALAARVAQLDAFAGGLDRVVAYLPTLMAGGLIILAGYLVGTLTRDIVTSAFASAGSTQSELFGFVAQSAVFLTAVVIGLDQIRIDVTFLIILLGVVVGGMLLSLALAFGVGAREFVSNLIAARQAQRMLEPGQLARIGDIEGRVLEITATSVVLLTDQGRLLLPAKLTQEQVTWILTGEEDE